MATHIEVTYKDNDLRELLLIKSIIAVTPNVDEGCTLILEIGDELTFPTVQESYEYFKDIFTNNTQGIEL